MIKLFYSYPEVNIAIGMDIKAQMKIKNWTKGLKNENGKVWLMDTTIENFALAKLIFDSALIFSYVFVNNAISILSNKVLTNMRKRIRRKFDIPCFQSFQVLYFNNQSCLIFVNFPGYSHVGDILMLMTYSCWQFKNVGDRIKILMTSFRCWCRTLMLNDRGCWWAKWLKPSPTS